MRGNIKAPEDRRSRQFVVRFTESEYASISSGAKNAGMSLSAYVRHLAVSGKVDVHYRLTQDSKDLGAILAQLGKIGSNLNQIARYFNRGGQTSGGIEERLSELMSDMFDIREKLAAL